MKTRKVLHILIPSVLFVLAALYILSILPKIDFNILLDISLQTWLLVIFLFITVQVLNIWYFQLILTRMCTINSLPKLFQVLFASYSLNYAGPLKLGMPVRVYLFKRILGVPYTAGIATVIATTGLDVFIIMTLVVSLSAWIFISPLAGFALGLALAGTALTVGPEGGQLLGILLAILAAAIYSVYITVGTQVMRQVSAIQASTVIFASAGSMSGILMMGSGPHLPATGAGWMVVGGTVLIATVLPVVAFLAGLERIGPTNAAMLSTLEPVVTVLLAAMLFGETLKPIVLLGGGLILGAVLLLTRGGMRRSEPVPVGD